MINPAEEKTHCLHKLYGLFKELTVRLSYKCHMMQKSSMVRQNDGESELSPFDDEISNRFFHRLLLKKDNKRKTIHLIRKKIDYR